MRAAVRQPTKSPRRRTTCGVPRAEARIAEDLEVIADAVANELGGRMSALLLVGGYARGEGSVVARDGELGPYNDYDLVAITRGASAASLRPPLAALGHRLTERIGVEVELWPVARSSLSSLPPTLFWLDVHLGAVEVLAGDEAVVRDLPDVSARDVPLVEAARLLANRAVGIALSNLEAEDRDLRRARHGHKAVLACGDALLLAADRYLPTIAERADELSRLRVAPAIGDRLAERYADAARFRERPDEWAPAGAEAPDAWYAEVVRDVATAHLGFEARRIGTPESAAGYATSRAALFHGAPDLSVPRLSALRAVVRRTTPLWPWVGHPRERLARVAVALAYQPDEEGSRAIASRLVGLRQGASDDELHIALFRLAEVAG